ncbi:MAG: response regulator [Candidatus Saccharimonadales bacterium]
MNILLIEPDHILSQTYFTFLNRRGHETIIASTAGSAINTLENTAIDIIVVELQIAEHNGIELLHEIRSYSEWQNVPVIVNSFIPIEIIGIDAKVLREFHIVDYLYKPVTSLGDLAIVIESLEPVST